MKPAKKRANGGYTIVETMIFLIITSALMVSAALLFNGKISRSQFSQAVQVLDSTINTTVNQVSTGQYPSDANFSCQGGGNAPPTVNSNDPTSQGTHTGCIFVGKVLQAGTNVDNNKLNIYTVMGNRLDVGGKEVTSLDKSFPKAIDDPNGIDLTNYSQLNSGLEVSKIIVKSDRSKIAAIGFFQTFGQEATDGKGLASGAQNVQVVPIGTDYPYPQAGSPSIDNSIQALTTPTTKDLSQGIVVCLGTGSDQASITIGLSNSNIATTVVVGQDPICQ